MQGPDLIWLQQIGTEDDRRGKANSIATDHLGNVFICGYNPLNRLERGAFLAKYSSEGTQEWLQYVGVSGDATATATDHLGNVFICGYSATAIDYEAGQFDVDVYLAKYTSGGTQEWLQYLGSATLDTPYAITTDYQGHVFIFGKTFSGGLAADQFKSGSDTLFLAKYRDTLSVSQHHLLIDSKVNELAKELAQIKLAQLPLQLNLSLIQVANDSTVSGRRISKEKAKEMVAMASDSDMKINDINKKTLAYIYAVYRLGGGAKVQIVAALAP